MTEIQEELVKESPPEETVEEVENSSKEEIVNEEEEQDIDALLEVAIEDNSYRNKAKDIMRRVDKKLGILALEDSKNWTEGNLLEEIIHYMRWSPDYLFVCPIEILHQYEMVLAAHITYVQSKENHWETMVKIANRDLQRGIKLASCHCQGKSIGEREALAMVKFERLANVEKRLDMFNIYKDKCKNIASTFTQMDNSLKKTLERRKFEYEHFYNKEQQLNVRQ